MFDAGQTADLQKWIYSAFFRRTSKLGIDFTTSRGHTVHFNISGPGGFVYTPDTGFTGVDTVEYTTNHGTFTVTIYVGVPAPQRAVDDAYTFESDDTLTIDAPNITFTAGSGSLA